MPRLTSTDPSLYRGRLLVLTAAILWSSSGAFVKTSTLPALSIAMNRSLIAGLVLLAFACLRRVRFEWHPMLFAMTASFAAMNYFFIASMTYTTAANAIFLQYTAPVWVFLASRWLLGEPLDRANRWAFWGALAGVSVLIGGNWSGQQDHWGIVLGLLSGITFAGVALTMRHLREFDSLWLATLNHLSAGVVLSLIAVVSCVLGLYPWDALLLDKTSDVVVLSLFGVFQMALPYVLFGLGLRYVAAQEAALLTLAEPLLNPLWTYLAVGEIPSAPTLAGGGILLATLALRYLPTNFGVSPPPNRPAVN